MDEKFFLRPQTDWQRRYEALRASFVERLPAQAVARRFGFQTSYVYLLRHQFKKGLVTFDEPPEPGKVKRRRVNKEARQKIRQAREANLSAGEIAQLLHDQRVELSVSTVERVLKEEGFAKLPRRSHLKMGVNRQGALVPEKSRRLEVVKGEGGSLDCDHAGAYLFLPWIEMLGLAELARSSALPGSKMIPALSYILSFLGLKLLGAERLSHVGDFSFDRGLGLFAGLNVLPKCTAMSTYSYSLDEGHLRRFQEEFVKQCRKLRLYEESVINLDFHTVPHYGEQSVLETHWAGAKGKRVKGALTMFAQDASSKLIIYNDADLLRSEADDAILDFVAFYKKIRRTLPGTLIFDSKFTTYENLAELDGMGCKFITLRRRGAKLIEQADSIKEWKRIHVPHAKRKFPNPFVHDELVELPKFPKPLRQVIIKGTGREKPSFLISNDYKQPVELLVSDYSRRWRVENGIAEAVKFFHLNALSSPILVKVHFDLMLTVVADTLYYLLAQNLRGFEECDAPRIYRHFIKGKGTVEFSDKQINVTFPRRAHNPVLRKVPWQNLPNRISWLGYRKLNYRTYN
jgi:transposase